MQQSKRHLSDMPGKWDVSKGGKDSEDGEASKNGEEGLISSTVRRLAILYKKKKIPKNLLKKVITNL